MSNVTGRLCAIVVAVAMFGASGGDARAGNDIDPAAPAFTVDGAIALGAFMSLTDGHLRAIADSLRTLAGSEDARSAEWDRIKGPLGQSSSDATPALMWFALPDGSYWSVQEGRATGDLKGRPYFARALAGETVIGDLVVSKSTGKNVAVVAVPVTRKDGSVAAVLGGSVYLDRLSEVVKHEMDLRGNLIFFSFDAAPLLGVVWDEGLIFTEPKDLGKDVDRAFTEMLSKDHGVVTYTFRGRRRTVLFRRSELTGWRYGFGIVRGD